jgi:hypothetical protein
MLKRRSKRLCHIFHNFFKIDVDRFVRWGLYTGTTRAGRRWRLPNAPYSLVDWFACGLVDWVPEVKFKETVTEVTLFRD